MTCNITINVNIQTPTIITGKSSEQLAADYRKRIQAEDDMRARVYRRMVHRHRLADWARSLFGDDVANSILGGDY